MQRCGNTEEVNCSPAKRAEKWERLGKTPNEFFPDYKIYLR